MGDHINEDEHRSLSPFHIFQGCDAFEAEARGCVWSLSCPGASSDVIARRYKCLACVVPGWALPV